MTWGPIVVGVDASSAGVGAAAAGWEIAQAMGAQCSLVHAAREVWLGPAGAPGLVDLGVVMEDVMRASRAEVERALAGHVPKELVAAIIIKILPISLRYLHPKASTLWIAAPLAVSGVSAKVTA